MNLKRIASTLKRIAFTPIFPLWLDALVLAWVVHFGAILILRPSTVSAKFEILGELMREWWWWVFIFLPVYLLIYLPALICERWRVPLLVGTLVAYLLALIPMPMMTS